MSVDEDSERSGRVLRPDSPELWTSLEELERLFRAARGGNPRAVAIVERLFPWLLEAGDEPEPSVKG